MIIVGVIIAVRVSLAVVAVVVLRLLSGVRVRAVAVRVVIGSVFVASGSRGSAAVLFALVVVGVGFAVVDVVALPDGRGAILLLVARLDLKRLV